MSPLLRKTDSLGLPVVPTIFLRTRNLIFSLLSAFVTICFLFVTLVSGALRAPQQRPFFKLFTGGLTSLLADDFSDVADPLAFIRLGLAQAADLSGHLAEKLLVDPFQRDLRIFPFLLRRAQFQFLRHLEDDIVGIAKRQVQDISL